MLKCPPVRDAAERVRIVGKSRDVQQVIARLQEDLQPVQPDDAISEAGRKVLRGEFIKILQHEAGSRTGEDIEDVHKMRVAIRQTRSGFRLLDSYFKPGLLRTYRKDLRRLMRALGGVRDLDVMIHDLRAFGTLMDEAQAESLGDVIESLEQRRSVARDNLLAVLDSKGYRRFVRAYTDFLTTPGMGANLPGKAEPFQVRHVLPLMIYQHLAAVRAYDSLLEDADPPTLHALRIEFKGLRYSIALFRGVLGKEAESFIEELKKIQDLLGRLNDIEVAREAFIDLMEDLDGDQNAALWLYINHLDEEKPTLRAKVPATWQRFNSKTVQRKLALAVAGL
jgi:CHAD domain-containing protein